MNETDKIFFLCHKRYFKLTTVYVFSVIFPKLCSAYLRDAHHTQVEANHPPVEPQANQAPVEPQPNQTCMEPEGNLAPIECVALHSDVEPDTNQAPVKTKVGQVPDEPVVHLRAPVKPEAHPATDGHSTVTCLPEDMLALSDDLNMVLSLPHLGSTDMGMITIHIHSAS